MSESLMQQQLNFGVVLQPHIGCSFSGVWECCPSPWYPHTTGFTRVQTEQQFEMGG